MSDVAIPHIAPGRPHSPRVAELEALVAERGGEILSQGFMRSVWTFRCAAGHEWSRRADQELRRQWCRQCRTDAAVAELEAFVGSQGGEITERSIRVHDDWRFRCAVGHEWRRQPGSQELSESDWCHYCRIDAEALATILEKRDAGPPCMDCWERPTPGNRDTCRLCRSRQRRGKKALVQVCAEGCGVMAKRGWTRCPACVKARMAESGRMFQSVENHRRWLEDTIRRSAIAAEKYGPCACGNEIAAGVAKLIDPVRGYTAKGTLVRAEAEGWPDRYEAACVHCWPKCSRCKARVRLPAAVDGVCPGCLPAVEAEEEEEEAARRAASAARERDRRDREDRELERQEVREERRAGAACLTCGLPTRHLNRTTCDACSEVDPEVVALKVRVMEAYGGECSSCGCSILAFLRIDHIDRARPDGAPRTGPGLWAWLEGKGWPTDHFRCLCSKCNQASEFYGYLPAGGRPADWDHDMLMSKLDRGAAMDRLRALCRQVERVRKATPYRFVKKVITGVSVERFAEHWHMNQRTVMSLSLTASGSEPADGECAAKPWIGMPGAQTLRKIEAILGLEGRVCRTCGHCLPASEYGTQEGYEGRMDHLKTSRAGEAVHANHCRPCRRAKTLWVRLSVFKKYGGACDCCGETLYEFLAVDHVGGVKPDGWPTHGNALYDRLDREPRRRMFRLLCHDCNWSYFRYGQRCPHQWVTPGRSLLSQSTMTTPPASRMVDAGIPTDGASCYDTATVATVHVGSRRAAVDADRLQEVEVHRWRPLAQGGITYAIASLPRRDGKQRTLYLHRLIAGAADGEVVRHIDGDGLNNTTANLRVVGVAALTVALDDPPRSAGAARLDDERESLLESIEDMLA